MEETAHWTSRSLEAFMRRITFDFIAQLEKKLEAMPLSQADLAKKLNVSKGAVSQVLNNPPNLRLKTIVKYARALGLKVAIVAYDDRDPDNNNGPVGSEIFSTCWENANRPTDLWSLQKVTPPINEAFSDEYIVVPMGKGLYVNRKSAGTNSPVNIPLKEIERLLSQGPNTQQTATNRGLAKREGRAIIEVTQ